MGTHMRVLSEGYPMNTNVTGFTLGVFKKSLGSCALDECSLSIERVNQTAAILTLYTVP